MIWNLLHGLLVVVLVVAGLGFLASLLFGLLLRIRSATTGSVSHAVRMRLFAFWAVSTATFVLGAVGMAVLSYFESEERVQLTERRVKVIEKIVSATKPLVMQCRGLGDTRPFPIPKDFLVLDLRTSDWRRAADKLPAELRGEPGDADLLVVLIVEVREELIPHYYSDGADGWQQTADVAVVRWPSKEAVGLYTVTCEPPLLGLFVVGEKRKGDLEAAVASSWVKARPESASGPK